MKTLVVLLLALLFSTNALAQDLDESFVPVFAGPTSVTSNVVVRPDGKYVAIGDFTVVRGVRRNLIAVFNADGTIDTAFDIGDPSSTTPQSSLNISRIAVQPDNKMIIYGSFTHINGIARPRIVRLNLDGSVDPTFNVGLGPNSTVAGIEALTNGKILVGGSFNTFNGQSVQPLIRLMQDGSVDPSFTANLLSFGGVSDFKVLGDGKILATGDISSPVTNQFVGIARYFPDGGFDGSFNPGTGAAGISRLTVSPDGKILISGSFTSFNNVARNRNARLNGDGSLDTTFSFALTGPSPGIEATFAVQPNGKVLISGLFDTVNGTPRRRIARLNDDGSTDLSFSTIIDENATSIGSVVRAIAVSDSLIFIVGDFQLVNGVFRSGLAKLDSTGGVDQSFDLNSNFAGSPARAVMTEDQKVIVVGSFRYVNNRYQNGIVRLLANGTPDLTFNVGRGVFDSSAGSSGALYSAAVQSDGKILVGGSFRTMNDLVRPNLARLNPDGSVDTTFPNLSTVGFVRHIILRPDGKILTFGDSVRRINTDGTFDGSFVPGTGPNSQIFDAVLLPDGKIVVVGSFSTFNGVSRLGIARLNENGSLDATFTASAGTGSVVRSIALQTDGKLVVVGTFTTMNTVARNRIARLNSDGSLDSSFDIGLGANKPVSAALVQPDGKVIIGGNFGTIGGVAQPFFARLNTTGSVDTSFGSNLSWFTTSGTGVDFSSLAHSNGRLYALGNFSKVNTRKISGMVRLNLIFGATQFDFDGDRKTDISIFRPSNGQWWLNRSTAGLIVHTFGNSDDKLVPGDFTGDGKTDVAIFRPSDGSWYVLRSEDSTFYSFPFGASGDSPVPGDYDADGKADAAVFRPSDSTWYIQRSSGGTTIQGFGSTGDFPVPADYDGDGKTDIAIFRPSNGQWWLNRSTSGLIVHTFGNATDKNVQGDYTGDGKADIAIWRPSDGNWFILRSEDASFYSFPFGANGDLPVPGDYDGDGKFDAGVFRPSNSTWYLNRSTSGLLIQNFGASTDLPVPNHSVRP